MSFLVPAATRGRGSGRHLALAFLYFAPKLGYKSSIFNLVFATNIASIRLWEKLGFERVGIVKGAGSLKGYTELIDAYIYGYQFSEISVAELRRRRAKITFQMDSCGMCNLARNIVLGNYDCLHDG